jgi:hypothetical protein
MDKWKILKEYVKNQMARFDVGTVEYHTLVEVFTIIQDLDAIEITNKTHGHENG